MKMINCILVGLLTAAMCMPAWAEPGSTSTAKSTQKAGEPAPGKSTLRRSNRMEFDGRLVKGEKAAGAVYLFQRAPRRLPPLLRLKRDQLDRIVLPVLKRPADPVAPVSTAVPAVDVKATPDGARVRPGKAARKGRKALKRTKKRSKSRKKKRTKRKGKKRR